jgi:aryl-alcohol dehydrogenase-like predicted oxidoreductase
MPYGVANRTGQPSLREVERILEVARESGVRVLDTARAYGQSEEVIGSSTAGDTHFRIVTKLTPDLPGSELEIIDAAADSLERSRQALARDTLDTVLLHRPEHLDHGSGAAWRALVREREEGRIRRIGVSVLTPDQASRLVDHPEIDVLQVAFNLLDRRLFESGFFARAMAKRKEVFVRSVFLQGVAFLAVDELDPYLAPLRATLTDLDGWAAERGLTRAELFLRYAQARGVHLVIGCESADQLQKNLDMWKLGPLPAEQIEEVEALLPELSPALVDPSKWQLAGSR